MAGEISKAKAGFELGISIALANQGSVVQSIVSLTSSWVVKTLTVLVSTIFKSQVFLLKNVSSFCKCKSYSHFFQQNISVYAIFNDQSLNDTSTNDIASFQQLGPGVLTARLYISPWRNRRPAVEDAIFCRCEQRTPRPLCVLVQRRDPYATCGQRMPRSAYAFAY